MARIRHVGDPKRDHIQAMDGIEVTKIKAAEPGDQGYEAGAAKTIVEDAAGKRYCVYNDEVTE